MEGTGNSKPEAKAQTKTQTTYAESDTRKFTGGMRNVVAALCITLSLYTVLYVGGIFHRFDIYIGAGTHRGIAFALVLTILFLLMPATKSSPRDRVPWYDVALIILAVAPSIYYAVNYNAIMNRGMLASLPEAGLGAIAVLVTIEAARRSTGSAVAILGIVAVIFPFVSQFAPAFLYARANDFKHVMEVIYFYPDGIFGSAWQIASTVIIVYMVFGVFLNIGGAGKFFIDLSMAVLGHTRGGPAKVAVLSSAFFSMISGSCVANVASVGVITIPMMKKIGYRPAFAAAVESVASNAGPLTPPVMAAIVFIMAEYLDTTYLAIAIAAAIPAFLYFAAVMLMVDMEAARSHLKGLPREQLPSLWKTLRNGWVYVVPIAFLIYMLAVMRYSAQTACIYTMGVIIVTSWFKKESRIGVRGVLRALEEGAKGLPGITAAVAVAGILTGALTVTGLSYGLAGDIVNFVQGNTLLLLVLAALVCLILGLAANTTAVYLIAVIVMVPALVTAGVEPISAHFFVLYMAQTSMLTPPIAIVVFVAATIAGSGFMRTGLEAMRLGVVTFILPFAFAYSAALLMVGSPVDIGKAFVTALIGVYFLSAGLLGHVLGKIPWISRAVLVATGLILFGPFDLTVMLGAAVAGSLPLLWQVWRYKTRSLELGGAGVPGSPT